MPLIKGRSVYGGDVEEHEGKAAYLTIALYCRVHLQKEDNHGN